MGFKIGIIADSHGDAQLIESSLDFLQSTGCQTIYHLGDICDSYYLTETAACIQLLQERRILAIKGNNDHVITQYHATHENLNMTRAQKEYLNHLPLVREYRNAVFTHSLPFEHKLGLSCMIRPLDEYWTDRFFKGFPGKILFRGHSHDPEIVSGDIPQSETNPIPLNHPINLQHHNPCIITCGALIEKLCMIWQPDEQRITSLTF